jgi:hypothetical protein
MSYSKIALSINISLALLIMIVNYNLKIDVVGLDSHKDKVAYSLKSEYRNVPLKSNTKKISDLLVSLSKIYISSIQITNIKYEIKSNIAEISIKSADLSKLNDYLIKLNILLKKEKSYILDINILDKDNQEVIAIEPEPVISENKTVSSILNYVLDYLNSKQVTLNAAPEQKSPELADDENDDSYQYKVNLKIHL